MKLKLEEDNDNIIYEEILKNPAKLRKELDELGLTKHMIFRVNKGSVIPYLYCPERLCENIKNIKQASYFSFLDGQVLNISKVLSPKHNIYYNIDHLNMQQQSRGNIKTKIINAKNEQEINTENQPHYFPVGYQAIGLNVDKYRDKEWLGSNEEDGVWMTLYHGTKPDLQFGYTHINDIPETGFRISQNTQKITYQDDMANQECRFRKKDIGPNNIYFANNIRSEQDAYRNDNGGAEVYTKPIKILNHEYNIIFMCRGDPQQVYSPTQFPIQFLVKHNNFVRPYKILIMEFIKNEDEITFSFRRKNKQFQYTNFKLYMNESMKSLVNKLMNSNIFNPKKEKLVLNLKNNSYLEFDEKENREISFGQVIMQESPEKQLIQDQSEKIIRYIGSIIPKSN